MIFNKKANPSESSKTKLQLADGESALKHVLASSGTRIFNNKLAAAVGYALTGKRAAAFTNSRDISLYQLLQTYRTRNFSLVIFHDISSSSDFLKSFDFGDDFIVMQSADSQELIDFGLIAQSISEHTLMPVICLFDRTYCADSIGHLHIPEQKTIGTFLGKDSDSIEAPTPAQRMIFGEARKRIPAIINPDRPLGSGLLYDTDTGLNQMAGRRPFVKDHVSEIIAKRFSVFAELTKRTYASIRLNDTEKADYLIACSGPLSNTILDFYRYASESLSAKVGIAAFSVLIPFDQASISHVVKKKKALTVLEDLGTLNLHIYKNIKSAMNKAWENGRINNNNIPNPGYAVYSRIKDQPEVFRGYYSQTIPSSEKLFAVINNMKNKINPRRDYFVGLNIDVNQTRFPKLETLQQQIRQAYPKINELSLPSEKIQKPPIKPGDQKKIEFYMPVSQGLNEFNKIIAADFSINGINSIRLLGNEQKSEILPYNKLTLIYSKSKGKTLFPFSETDIIILSNMLFEGKIDNISNKGLVLINSPLSPETLWVRLSESNRRTIRDKNLSLYYINAGKIASEISVIHATRETLSMYVLFGALLRIENQKTVNDFKQRKSNLSKLLNDQKLFNSQIKEILNGTEQGFTNVSELNWNKIPEFSGLKKPEEETPWPVKEVKVTDGTIYDLARSWDSVGYLYRTDQRQQLLNDPFLASNTIPARSSSFRDLAPITEKVPELISEKCSGCGMCWSQCPDSALPSTITSPAEILNTALTKLAAKGQKLIQIQRISENLSKQAYKLFSTDELRRYLNAGTLFEDAFKHLSQKMGLKADQLKKVEDEFKIILAEIGYMPIIKTTPFFDAAHDNMKGSGKILSINVNPAACKGCTSCVNVCPENALEMVESTNNVIEKYRKNFDFQNLLPEEDIQPFLNPDNDDTLVNLLLQKKTYYTMTGGDNAFPGSGVKTTMHLVMAAIESVMNSRYKEFIKKIDVLIRQLEEKIQGRLQSSVQINEFEEFGQKLSQLEGKELEVSDLVGLLEPKDPRKKIDGKQIQRLTDLNQKLKAIQKEYVSAANGNGRARMTSVLNSSGLLYWCAGYPFNSFSNPWVNATGSDLAMTVNGLFEGITLNLAGTFKWLHFAELELNDEQYDAEQNNQDFGWDDLSSDEKALCPPALLFIDNKMLAQQNLHGLDALAGQEKPVYIVVINNMSQLATSESQINWPLNYTNLNILQSTAAKPGHLLSGVVEMISSMRPGIMHLYACEPHMQGLAEFEANRHHKRAVDSRTFPIYKYNPAESDYFTECFDLKGNPALEEDWLSLTKKDDAEKFTFADWAIHEKEYRNEFHAISKGELDAGYIPLADYLYLDDAKKKEFKPYIEIKDFKDQNHPIIMADKIVRLSEFVLANWRMMQELAGIKTHDRSYIEDKWQQKLDNEISKQKQTLEGEYNAQLNHIQKEHWQIYQGRLKEKLKALYNMKKEGNNAEKTLADYAKNKE